MAVSGMRGLSVFVSDIRNCQNKEMERLRVDKELANIRTKFKGERLTPYEQKKYVWKMMYIYMLGYDVDFGHLEAIALISAPKYAEKQVGYIVTSCLLNENNDFLRLVINTVRNDVIGRNETAQCLALTMVGNVGGKEFSESLAPDVQRLLTSSGVRPLVKKKATLCLLRLYRKNPDVVNDEGWAEKMAILLEERDLGVLHAVMSLLVALVAGNPEGYWPCVPKCVRILERLTRGQDIPQEYTYYGIPSPWLQVKTMRALQYFPSIDDANVRSALMEVLQRILMGTDVVKNVNKNNAAHAVLFEALALVMHLDAEREMMAQCVGLLGKFIAVREPNIRYLGLENMARMLLVADVQESIRKHQPQIVASLKDPDISIRRRALDLLYAMCDVSNAKEIVEELLQYLSLADFAIREELALKAAILAEKFAPDLSWYVEVILQLIEKAGDFVSDDIWHRVVQFVTNNEDLQAFAALKVKSAITDKVAVHETLVKAAGYILGEYSHLLSQHPGCSPLEIFTLLNDKFPTVSTPTKALLLSSYIKILLHTQPADPQLVEEVNAVFKKHESYIDAEVQQRAVEYKALSQRGGSMADVLAEMPKFPERESALLKRAEDSTDGDAEEKSSHTQRAALTSASQALVLAGGGSGGSGRNGTQLPVQRPVLSAAAAEATKESEPVDIPAAEQPPEEPANGLLMLEGPEDLGGVPEPPPAPPVAPRLDPLMELLSLEAPPPPAPAMPLNGMAGNGLDGYPPGAQLGGEQEAGNGLGAAAPYETGNGAGDALALTLVEPPAANQSVQPTGSVMEWFEALLLRDAGVLYEDPFLQIGVKAEWRGAQGRLLLFLGNYKETGSISGVRAAVKPAAGLRLLLGPVPPTIPPRAQIQVAIDVAAVQIPREVPVLEFSYTTPAGQPVSLRLGLPVIMAKFLQPAVLAAADFFSRWKAIVGPPLKLQQVLRHLKPLALPELTQYLGALHVGVAPNLDPNPNNLVAASSLYTETAPPTLLLVRIETDPSDRTQLRLTIGSQDPAATAGLVEFLRQQLTARSPTGVAPTTETLLALPAPPPPLLRSSPNPVFLLRPFPWVLAALQHP
eukprot:TRINITY_DN9462_c0_g1_i2.p1 TRINITY_DN9462_c0_g1~~TRINITY_DN9462_c0_g1_i2.p1  ORF type:complete len:1084 (+),score=251.00 TRINITY_DN9462_c0_g1_i2:248-3499(+)